MQSGKPSPAISLLCKKDVKASNRNLSKNVAVYVIPAGVTLNGAGHTISADGENWVKFSNSDTNSHILGVNGPGGTTTIKNLTIIGLNTENMKSKAGINAYDGAKVEIENVTIQKLWFRRRSGQWRDGGSDEFEHQRQRLGFYQCGQRKRQCYRRIDL